MVGEDITIAAREAAQKKRDALANAAVEDNESMAAEAVEPEAESRVSTAE